MSKFYQSGFSAILIIVILVIVGFLGVALFKAIQMFPEKNKETAQKFSQHNSGGAPQNCEDKKGVKLAYSPLKVEDLDYIMPLGRMADSHVTPTDHQYWTPKGAEFTSDLTTQEAVYDIYAPADGVIGQLEHHTQVYSDSRAPKIDDYRLIIYHSCDVYSIFIHIDKLSAKIASQLTQAGPSQAGTTSYSVNIPVKAGEVIGKLGKHPFDFSVHDQSVSLKGLINPDRYQSEFWKIHTVDPFDYFVTDVSSQLKGKSLRSVPPLGGKIDYDIEGKLVGNWFREGTEGTGMASDQKYGGRFWDGHLSIAYDHLDPTKIIVSMGNFGGKSAQFAIKGNLPDPKDVGLGQLVKYELVSFHYLDKNNKKWDQKTLAKGLKLVEETNLAGVVLFQLTEKSKLRIETFPGQSVSQVNNFTPKAQTYTR